MTDAIAVGSTPLSFGGPNIVVGSSPGPRVPIFWPISTGILVDSCSRIGSRYRLTTIWVILSVTVGIRSGRVPPESPFGMSTRRRGPPRDGTVAARGNTHRCPAPALASRLPTHLIGLS
jgi:hypothetical protein